MLQTAIRGLAHALSVLADRVAVFDDELGDATAGANYKTAIKARIKAQLQVIADNLAAVIGQL